jgi:NAD(P)-dependent dehydrogenase (short-subunit alcohol dehydrogenase family)
MLDVTEPESVAAATARIAAQVADNGLYGLVNNAGVAYTGPLEFVAVDDLRQQFEVNVLGQVAVTQACLPLLRQARGRIIMISSVSGLLALPLMGPYTASKFALEALSDALRVELRPWGIPVVLVEPAGIVTPIWEKSLAIADTRLRAWPRQVEERYGKVIQVVRRHAEGASQNSLPVVRVSQVVVQALTARKPKVRYVIGTSAGLLFLLRQAPTALRDWVIARNMGMK